MTTRSEQNPLLRLMIQTTFWILVVLLLYKSAIPPGAIFISAAKFIKNAFFFVECTMYVYGLDVWIVGLNLYIEIIVYRFL